MKTVFTIALDKTKKPFNRIFKGEIEGVEFNGITPSQTIEIDVHNVADTREVFRVLIFTKETEMGRIILEVSNAINSEGDNCAELFEGCEIHSSLAISFQPLDFDKESVKRFLDNDIPEALTIIKSGYDYAHLEEQMFFVIREMPDNYLTDIMSRADIRSKFKIEI